MAGESPRPLPLPLVGDKALAVTPGQRSVRAPLRFAKVEAFYRSEFRETAGVELRSSLRGGRRVLTVLSLRTGDAWAKAVVHEGDVDTLIEVTPVLRMDAQQVDGHAMPVVLFIARSREVERALDSIEHLEHR